VHQIRASLSLVVGSSEKGTDPRCRLNYQVGTKRCIRRLGPSESEFLFQADVLLFCLTTSVFQVCDVSCFPIAICSLDDKSAGKWKSCVFPSASRHWLVEPIRLSNSQIRRLVDWKIQEFRCFHSTMAETLTSIRLSDDKIQIVNQLLLPHTTEWLAIDTIEQAHDAIRSMKVQSIHFNGSLVFIHSYPRFVAHLPLLLLLRLPSPSISTALSDLLLHPTSSRPRKLSKRTSPQY
jgi:hypothetical protein